ncbi:histamine N-methyltransferase-like [Acanthaster planci]|uniref:Histamine N-methyltransferase-like n=1 Tax=Acanthaster planci TaxID=133434 RepID=A0A8B7XI65_ACAPL|nr:histamine N-methyltransferase-like [Acanthaster planci]XP_022079625.1 histamine N-methyltransferase-like [Acanthaster planci]XP_022079626.1 histamine N-methyltransferase-like [Acanthaster planci]
MSGHHSAANLLALSESGDYYNVALDLYDRGSRRIQRISEWVDDNLAGLADSITCTLGEEEDFMVLSVGPGDGFIDSKIAQHLRGLVHAKIRVVVLEPDSHMMQRYQDLVKKESAKLQGVNFDWRQQTFQEYQATAEEDEKFHFISCISSIYYCGDLDKSLEYLYGKLHVGGLLTIVLMAGEGGFGRLWEYLNKTLGRKMDFFTSTDVEQACRRQNIPIADTQTIRITSNISACFDLPQQLSKGGDILLDFLTHTVNFAQNTPTEYRDEVLGYLRSDACSGTGPTGEVIFNGFDSAVIIQKQ